MHFGLDVPTTGEYADPRVLAKLAAEAEAAGWDGFFVWDVLAGVDPWLALTAVALSTERVRLGHMVLPLGRHQPYLTAKRLAELDRLSGARVVCAVGLGGDDFAPFGEPPDLARRAARLDEGLAVVDGLWREQPFSFHGDHYQLRDITLATEPLQQPRIPVWVAGGWPYRAPFRRAARWDGVSFKSVNGVTRAWLSVEEFRAGLAYVRAHRTADGSFEVVMSGDTSGPRDEGAAKARTFADAGATWWVEEGLGWELEEFREHVRRGPPRSS